MWRRWLVLGLAVGVIAVAFAALALAAPVTPTLVKDINPGAASSGPSGLTNVNGALFFAATDGTHGNELWKSDGTAAGTVMVKDINPGAGDSFPSQLTNVNGTLFFSADDGTHGPQLWKSDGTTAGTVMVKLINPGGSAVPLHFANVNGTLFFSATDGTNGVELWKSDGTAAGTVMVKDINPGASGSLPYGLTNVNGTLFFGADDGTDGSELWKSDGTPAGTVMVKDIWPGANSSGPLDLTNVNGTLFFNANDGTHSTQLWKSDGTAAGTVMVKDINPPGGSAPSFLTDVNGTLFFAAQDTTNGNELWKSDGTAAGTVMVKDINPGAAASAPSDLASFNGRLFFAATDGTNGRQVWTSDGTAAGTMMLKDINPGGDSSPNQFTASSGTLFFPATDATNGRELWQTDGTSAGTVLVKDINPGTASSSPGPLADVNGTLFFSADDGTHGSELWSMATTTKDPTSTSVSCSPASVAAGRTTTCTATVTDTSAGTKSTPVGGVNFSSDSPGSFANPGNSCALSDVTPGTASCSVDYTPASAGSGTHKITGSYGGDGTHAGGSGSGNVTVTTTPRRPTRTAILCSATSVAVGTKASCAVTVTDAGNASVITPTGTVTFSSDSHGTFGNPGASCALIQLGAGQSSCHVDYTASAVDSGTHTITGTYGGDATHTGSNGQGSVSVSPPPQSPPQNTAPPSIAPDQSCQASLGHFHCQPIPYQYVCDPGQWAGNDPRLPFQFEWQQLYYRRLGLAFTSYWNTEATGPTYYSVHRFSVDTPSGIFRCLVTATGRGGSTSAASPTTHLDVGPLLPPGVHLPTPVNVIVTGIEVTQGTQEAPCPGCVFSDPSHIPCANCAAPGTLPSRDQANPDAAGDATYSGVTMAAGKYTVVRVFAHLAQNGSATTLAGATAKLEVISSDGTVLSTWSPDGVPTAALTRSTNCLCVSLAERANPGSSFNFLLPGEETNHQYLSFRATVIPPTGPGQAGQCHGCRGNVFTLDFVPFKQTATVTIWPIPLTIGGVRTPPDREQWLQQTFGDVQTVMPNPVRILPWDGTLAVDGLAKSDALEAVDDRAQDNNLPSSIMPIGVYVPGAYPGLSINGSLSHGTLFNDDNPPAAIVQYCIPNDCRPLTTVAHEITHTLAIGHSDVPTRAPGDNTPDCGGDSGGSGSGHFGEAWPPDYEGRIQGVGFDRRYWNIFQTGSMPSTFVEGFDHQGNPTNKSNVNGGPQYYDYMSYCPPGGIFLPAGANPPEPLDWISPHNWQRMVDFHPPAQSLPAAADPRAHAAQGTPLRVIAGVDASGRGSIFDITPGRQSKGLPTPGSPFGFELEDAAGHVLANVVANTTAIHMDGYPSAILLTATLPLVPGTAALVLTANGHELVRRMRPAHAPTARFLSPRPGSRVGRTRTTLVRFSAYDADGNRLTAKVYYSDDGGRSWRVVASGVSGGVARVPSSLLAASSDGRLQVRVSDGFNLTTVTSGRLRVAGSPPLVRIIGAPRQGHVLADETLLLQGSAFDDADRPLTGRSLRWYLGRRLIGRGEQMTLRGAPPGNIIIRLVATDSRGRSAQATLRLRVSAVAARYVLFDAPLLVSPRASTIHIQVAADAPATFGIAGKRYAVGLRPRTITLRIRPGKSLLRFACSLRSAGGVIRGTYFALR